MTANKRGPAQNTAALQSSIAVRVGSAVYGMAAVSLCIVESLCSYHRLCFHTWLSAQGAICRAFCPAGVATLGCRATAACQLVCKQQLVCTSTISQLVSVCTCVRFAVCSSVACVQAATYAHCCSCCWHHWTSPGGHTSIFGRSEAHVVSPIEDVRGEWLAQACR